MSETTETTETTEEDLNTNSGNEDENSTEDEETDDTTFSREYVQQLRSEAADNRVKAKDRDTMAQRLHTSLTAATGRLADPSDLPYEDEHLEDAEALTAAIDELLEAKPHLASRKVNGDVGQGASGESGSVDLAGMLRSRA